MRSRNSASSRTRSRSHSNIPDYHAIGDKWEKIDFANMATVDRGVAAGILQLADEPDAPKWSSAKGAAIYRDAGR